eukprot:CAMPEP_0177712806 /NCGR_PEP_ID=MMETSP0484_2-20121128/12599_1 /TAXON_ID=354590 /ORGANISM="Rhodomonas lens, Strain RHODO" /LENGTH=101 /DNA_ID=CAMNT_0019224647 /DNA_START=468 /DNA_END=769 /DNA_ORIENTATION=+
MSQYESTNCCSSHPTIVLAKACAPSGPASLECRLRSRMREQRASPSINTSALLHHPLDVQTLQRRAASKRRGQRAGSVLAVVGHGERHQLRTLAQRPRNLS